MKKHDPAHPSNRNALEIYFQDLKVLLLRELAVFTIDIPFTEQDNVRFTELLEEILYIRELLAKSAQE